MPDQITLDFQNGRQFLRKGYDGTHGYIVKNGRYEPMRPGEAVEMAEEPTFYSDLMEAYAQNAPVKLVGAETIDGVPCYLLSWQKGPNDEQMYWVNQETFLNKQTGEYAEDKAPCWHLLQNTPEELPPPVCHHQNRPGRAIHRWLIGGIVTDVIVVDYVGVLKSSKLIRLVEL